jgi:hypothetical protein
VYAVEFVEAAIREITRLRAKGESADPRRDRGATEPRTDDGDTPAKSAHGSRAPMGEPAARLAASRWRVFYDVDEDLKSVIVRAVRKKGRKLTEETL